jgi:hypothetical protein
MNGMPPARDTISGRAATAKSARISEATIPLGPGRVVVYITVNT